MIPCIRCETPFDPVALQACPSCGLSTVLRGVCRLEGLLGEGRTSRVYSARALRDGAPFAIKVMTLGSEADWETRERFEHGALLLQQLTHPLLPRAYGVWHDDEGRIFLAQERFFGGTLHERLSGTAAAHLDPRQVRALLGKLLELLVFLHGRVPPVLHRDIKPTNIMFRSAEDWEPVLLDFDTVAAAPSQRSGLTMVGTPGYAAPEQLIGEPEAASDLYSLGATLLAVVTHTDAGDLPRSRGRFVVDAQLGVLDPTTRRVLERMVEPALSERYATAAEVLAELERGETAPCAWDELPGGAGGFDSTQDRDPGLQAGADRYATQPSEPVGPSAPLGLGSRSLTAAPQVALAPRARVATAGVLVALLGMLVGLVVAAGQMVKSCQKVAGPAAPAVSRVQPALEPTPVQLPSPTARCEGDDATWVETEVPGGSLRVCGACEPDAILGVIAKGWERVDACRARFLRSQPTAAGLVSLTWTLGPDGSVDRRRVAVATSGSAARTLEVCLERVPARDWTFPSPREGSCRVQLPVVFGPGAERLPPVHPTSSADPAGGSEEPAPDPVLAEKQYLRAVCSGLLRCYDEHSAWGQVGGTVAVTSDGKGRVKVKFESGGGVRTPRAVGRCITAKAKAAAKATAYEVPGTATCFYSGTYLKGTQMMSFGREFVRKGAAPSRPR